MKPITPHWLGRGKVWFRDERGMSLVQSLLAIAIMGTAIVTTLVALSTGSIAVSIGDQETSAQSLVRSQLEYTKSYPYDSGAATYPGIDTFDAVHNPNPIALPDGYSILAETSSVPGTDNNIQKITVTVSRDGGILSVMEGFKVNR